MPLVHLMTPCALCSEKMNSYSSSLLSCHECSCPITSCWSVKCMVLFWYVFSPCCSSNFAPHTGTKTYQCKLDSAYCTEWCDPDVQIDLLQNRRPRKCYNYASKSLLAVNNLKFCIVLRLFWVVVLKGIPKLLKYVESRCEQCSTSLLICPILSLESTHLVSVVQTLIFMLSVSSIIVVLSPFPIL